MQENIDIPFFNMTSRNKKLYEYYSDDETLKGIEDFYHRDIENLGYSRPF